MYGIDLRYALYGNERQSLRRILRLAEALPPGSATHIAIHGQAALWTTEHELLAIVVEVLHHQTATIAKAFGGRGDTTPLKLPRPYDEAERRDDVQRLETGEDVAALFGLTKVG